MWKQSKIKISVGILLVLVVLSTSFYILLPEKIRIDFQKTKTVFSIYNNDTGKFVISGIEYSRIFDGTKLMRANFRNISYSINEKTTEWYRIARFKQDIIVEDFVVFDNDVTDVENVPVSHKVCITNAENKIFEYLITNIEYNGLTKEITSPFTFGKNMKVTFQDGYYRAKVYQQKVASDKIIVRYRVTSDYECFDIRLFDPIELSVSVTPIEKCHTEYYNVIEDVMGEVTKTRSVSLTEIHYINETHCANLTGKPSDCSIFNRYETTYGYTVEEEYQITEKIGEKSIQKAKEVCEIVGYDMGGQLLNCKKYGWKCYDLGDKILAKAPHQSDQDIPVCLSGERCDVFDKKTMIRDLRGYSPTYKIKRLEIE